MPRLDYLTKWFCCIALTVSISACSYKEKFESSPSDYGSRTQTDERTGLRSLNTQLQATDHNNNYISFRQDTSNVIDDMKGIRSSFVILTDKNAYVAIVLDGTATGASGKGAIKNSDRKITMNGSYNLRPHPTGIEILRPGDIVMDKNSFPTIPNPENISSELTKELTQAVKQMHPHISNVFVSANLEFINEFSQYAHEAWRGTSLQPQINQFNSLVHTHFGAQQILPSTNP